MKHLLNKKFCMIDLETLSTNQNAVIIQIGALFFTINNGFEDEFLINVEPVLQKKEYGLHIDKNTVEFWSKQPEEVRKSWQTDQKSLPVALNAFNTWLGDCKNTLLMSNGSVFDFGILRSAYEATGIVRPWPYWNELDIRTIDTILGTKMETQNNHNALEDCKNQTNHFINFFKD